MNKDRALYKGKTKDGIWVEGCLIIGVGSDRMHFYQIENADINEFRKWTVKKETVGQYTGLTDRNGKKIFEGDKAIWLQAKGGIIPADKKSYECLIEWSKSMSGWKCRLIDQTNHCGFTFSSEHLEVVGTIHD